MEELIQNLIEYLSIKMPDMALIDEDYGQLEMIDDDGKRCYPIVFPCILIDVPETQWSQIAGNSQLGESTVRVRLCIDCYDDTHFGSNTIEMISERMNIYKELHEALQGYCPGIQTPLNRTVSRFQTFNHNIKVYESMYMTSTEEDNKKDMSTVNKNNVRIKVHHVST